MFHVTKQYVSYNIVAACVRLFSDPVSVIGAETGASNDPENVISPFLLQLQRRDLRINVRRPRQCCS
jgi:hypothetical protein